MKVNRSPAKSYEQLLVTQKKIYESLKSEAQQLLGKTPAPIVAYDREYQKDFSKVAKSEAKRLKKVEKGALIKKIRQSDITLIADYHTFAQAQRTALRIIRDAVRPGEDWSIGIEMVPSHFQGELDAFQAGKLSLAEFHEIIDYKSEWGFPWQHYKPLFDWAREHKVRLIALNRPKELFYPFSSSERALTDLRKRDEWAAGIITDLFAARRSHSPTRMIVLYGELHVGRSHLPKEIQRISKYFIKRTLHCLSVHQNHDGLFWRLARKGVSAETIQLGPSNYCVFSSTPWAKLQSLVTWAESFSDPNEMAHEKASGHESDFSDLDSDFEADYHHWISTYSDFLSEIFQVPCPEIESATIKTVEEADFLDDLFKDGDYTSLEKRALRFQIENNLRTYIPGAEILYLASPTYNGAAELASIHLFRHINGSQTLFNGEPEDFYRRVLESMFGFFGSLLVNPKRKCDLPGDHARRLLTLKKTSSPEKEARELTVRFFAPSRGSAKIFPKGKHEDMASGLAKNLDHLIRLKLHGDVSRKLSTVLAAHYIGRVLAKKLHQALLQDKLNLERIRALVLKRASLSEHFHAHQVHKILAAVVDQQLESSKQDRL
jgi:hypothetical protein